MFHDINAIVAAFFSGRFRDLVKIRLVRIAFFGGVSFLVQATFFEIFGLRLAAFRPANAAILGGELAIITNFFLQNHFSFADHRLTWSWRLFHKLIQFNLGAVVSLAIQWLLVSLGEVLANGHWMTLRAFNVLGVLIGFGFNYLIYTRFIWRISAAESKTD